MMSGSVLLSPADLSELRNLCAPDFFAELGSAPFNRERLEKCGSAVIARRTVRVMIRFPDEQSARKWNAWHEGQIRKAGHAATAGIATLLYLSGAGAAMSAVAGAAAGMIKDELQVGVWYPRVSRRWTLIRQYDLTYEQFPSSRFHSKSMDTILDHNGRVFETRYGGVTEVPIADPGGEGGIPEEIVHHLMDMPDSTRTIVYR